MNDQIGFGFLGTKYATEQPLRDKYAPLTAPFQPTSDTSVKAAEEIEPHRLTQERRVFLAYKRRGRYGATMDEIDVELEIGIPSVCARTNKLADPDRPGGALIVKTERERITRRGGMASVYVAIERTD